MKAITTVFLLACMGLSNSFAQGAWTQKADFGGTSRQGAVGFSIGTKGYVGTGYDVSFKKDFWEYDPATNIWTQKANFGGTARTLAVGFSIGSFGYVGTGDTTTANGGQTKDFWEYNPVSNIWLQKSDFGGDARFGAVGFCVGTKGYLGTGGDGASLFYNDFWEYDPGANNWIQRANFGGTGRYTATGFSNWNKGYIGTGFDGNSRQQDFWEYNPVGDSWSQISMFANGSDGGRNQQISIAVGNRSFVGLGLSNLGEKNDWWEYDKGTNSWIQHSNFIGTPRVQSCGFTINNKAYLGTGTDGSNKSDFYEFDPCGFLTLTPSITNVKCYTGSDGSISVTPSGGTSPYTYLWSNGGTDNTANNLIAGNYSVTVTDSLSCTTADTFSVSEPPQWVISSQLTHVKCFGGNDGAIDVTVSGGTPPFTYLWTGGSTTEDISGLSQGVYQFLVFDTLGCSNGESYTINQADELTLTISFNAASSSSASDGFSSVTASGGTSPYSYLWSNGVASQINPDLAPGGYSITATDANACTVSGSIAISFPITAADMPSIGQQLVLAKDTSPVNVNFGSGGTDQSWDFTALQFEDTDLINVSNPSSVPGNENFPGADLAFNYPDDTMTIFMTQPQGGFYYSGMYGNFGYGPMPIVFTPKQKWLDLPSNYTDSFSGNSSYVFLVYYGQPPIDSVKQISHQYYDSHIDGLGTLSTPAYSNMNCLRQKITYIDTDSIFFKSFGTWQFGSASIDTSFTYRWWSDAVNFVVAEVNTNSADSIISAFYQKAPPPCNISLSTYSIPSVSNNGLASVNNSGGTSPFTYAWSNGSTSNTISNVGSGTYTVTVTDALGCSADTAVEVIQGIVDFSFTGDGGCAPGTIPFTNLSNLGTYTVSYIWYFNSDGPYTVFDTSYLFTNGGSSTVQLFAIDTGLNVLGQATHNVTLNGSTGSFVMAPSSACPGDNIIFSDESFAATSYHWDFGDGFSSEERTVIHSFSTPGLYDVTLLLNTGCGADTIIQQVNISTGTPLSPIFFSNANTTCPGDQAQFYSGNAAGTFTWVFGDGQSSISEIPWISHTYTNTGTYQVSVNIVNGCGNSYDTSLAVTIGNGNPISGPFTLSLNPNPVCPGDEVKMKFEQGEFYETYFWKMGDGDSLVGGAEMYHAYENQGTYPLEITVLDGCGNDTVLYDTVFVNSNVIPSAEDYTSGFTPSMACINDSILFFVDGNTAGSYQWYFGDSTSAPPSFQIDNSFVVFHAYQNTGIYNAVLLITNGCGNAAYDSMKVVIGDTVPVSTPIFGDGFTWEGKNDGPSPSCEYISFLAFGGSQFTWNFGDGSNIVTKNAPTVTHAFLNPGQYTVTLDVMNGCGFSKTYTEIITITGQCSQPQVNFNHNYQGGCPPVTVNFTNTSSGPIHHFAWYIFSGNNNVVIPGDSLSYTFSNGGNYQVRLDGFDDQNQKMGEYWQSLTIEGPTGFFSVQTDSACPGDPLIFSPSCINGCGGGNGNSPFSWDFGDGFTTTQGWVTHSYSSPGTYQVTLIDNSSNCGTDTVIDTMYIVNNYVPSVYLNADNAMGACPNDLIHLSAYGAAGIFTWNFGDGSPLFVTNEYNTEHAFPGTGTYLVTVTVLNGCGNSASDSVNVTITNSSPYTPNANGFINANPNPVCPGDPVEFRLDNASMNYATYVWNYGDGNTDTLHAGADYTIYHTYASTGSFNATLTIINGCGYDTTLSPVNMVVSNNVPINDGQVEFFAVPLESCPGDTVMFLAQDGFSSYFWSFGDGDTATVYNVFGGDMVGTQHPISDTGTYYPTLTVTNSCGSSNTDTMMFPLVVHNNVIPSTGIFGEPFGVINDDGEQLSVCKIDTFIAITGGSMFHWDFGDGSPLVSTTNPLISHVYIYTGPYTITLIAENSCGNSDTFYVNTMVAGVCPSPVVTITSANPTCNNSNNGYALANATGGNSPYSYLWSNGKNTALNGSLTAGTYTVTVTDSYMQTATASVTLTAPPAINISMSSNPATCGQANGLASVTASGGQTPYTFLWSNGQTSNIATGLSSGMYSVTVTASSGCKAIGSVTVGTSTGFAAAFNKTNITCNGINDGTATISASGGFTPYTYQWNTGQTSQALSGLGAGTYSATVTDNSGCTITGSVSITQPGVLALSLNGTNVSSCGGSNGAVNLIVVGGTTPYSYLWNNGSTNEDLANIQAGSYSVTVTDANGCSKNKNIQITAPSASNISFTKTNALCKGLCNGTATVSLSGGNTPFNYQWSNGSAGATATGLCAGNYSVTVTDNSGCASSDSVFVVDPAALSVSVTSSNAVCGVSNGTALANANGGTTPYSYQWTSGDSTALADSLPANTYMVTVTDNNGCNIFSSATVSDIGAPNINIVSADNVQCFGENNGDINIAVTGTGTPFTYQWSNGANTQDISSLTAGPYDVTVSNANGCISIASILIDQPEAVDIVFNATDASCGSANGEVTAIVSGGTTPYSYFWSNNDTTSAVTGLAAQVYDVIVTDAKGCEKSGSVAIGEVGGPVISIDSVANAHCLGTGSVFVSVGEGVPPYAYSWSNGSSSEDLTNAAVGNYSLIVTDAYGCSGALSVVVANSAVVSDPVCLITVDTATGTNKVVWQKTYGLGIESFRIYRESSMAGIYQLSGTVLFDSLSTFTDPVANPLVHSWRYRIAAVDSCGNESVMGPWHKTMHLTVNQGIGSTINLIWDNYEGFTYGSYFIWRYKPASGWTLVDSVASNLTSWTDYNAPTPFGLRYFIEIKHPDGCFATKTVENHNSSRSNKTYPIAPPPPALNVSSSVTDATQGNCDGVAVLSVSGGISPYTYLWNTVPQQTTETATGLCSGDFSVTVTDTEGDTVILTVTVGVQIGVKEGSGTALYRIYPNPSKGVFFLENTGKEVENASIVIVNLIGETVFQTRLSGPKHQTIIDISNHGMGVYFLMVITEKGASLPLKITLQ